MACILRCTSNPKDSAFLKQISHAGGMRCTTTTTYPGWPHFAAFRLLLRLHDLRLHSALKECHEIISAQKFVSIQYKCHKLTQLLFIIIEALPLRRFRFFFGGGGCFFFPHTDEQSSIHKHTRAHIRYLSPSIHTHTHLCITWARVLRRRETSVSGCCRQHGC